MKSCRVVMMYDGRRRHELAWLFVAVVVVGVVNVVTVVVPDVGGERVDEVFY